MLAARVLVVRSEAEAGAVAARRNAAGDVALAGWTDGALEPMAAPPGRMRLSHKVRR